MRFGASHNTCSGGSGSGGTNTGGTNTGVNPGFFQEKVTSLFAEVNGETQLLGNNLRYNAGARYATTTQTFASLSAPAARSSHIWTTGYSSQRDCSPGQGSMYGRRPRSSPSPR